MATSTPLLQEQIASVRRFNRFYTQWLGALRETPLDDHHNLTQTRLLWELANVATPLTAAELAQSLELNAGYLSRMLRELEQEGLIGSKRNATDGRQRPLMLTAAGRKAVARIDTASHDLLRSWFEPLSSADRARVVSSLMAVYQTLQATRPPASAFGLVGPSSQTTARVTAPRDDITLRQHRSGDIGWVISAHGELYAREFGWDISFEGLVAQICATIIEKFDPAFERGWIAEREGQRIGSVFLIRHSKTVAQLRLLLVDPSARGLGLGKRLVDECHRFARDRGYRTIMLWTNECLHAARAIYVAAGYTLTKSESHHSFGHDQVGQFWERSL